MLEQRAKRINESFSYLSLAGKDFSDQDLIECNFSHTDCTGTDFARSVLYRSDFTDAKLINAIISLNCHTFKDVRFDRRSTEYLLYLISLADIPEDILDGVLAILTEKKKNQLDKVFQNK